MNKGNRGSSMLGALGWQAVSKYANVLVQVIITMVLARLLSPDEYGTVAVVTVFLAFFNILADLGISTAIIQFKDLTARDYDGIFFFSLLMGASLSALFCVLGFPVSAIYGDPDLKLLCCASAPTVLFATLNMVPNGLLLKQKRFVSISARLVVASVGSGALAIVLAFYGAGCYALVAQSISSVAIVFIWNWYSTRPRLTNRRFSAPLRRIFRFSAFQGGFSVVNYFARNLDNLLVGAVMGSTALGYYDKAYKLMQYPINYLPGVFSSVLQPYLSDYSSDSKRVYECWVGILRVIAVVGFAIAAVFVSFSSEIVWVMYGEQWASVSPILAILAFSLVPQMGNSTSGAVYQSMGRTDFLFKSGVICTCVTITAIITGIYFKSIVSLAWFVSLAFYVSFGMTVWWLVWRVFGVRPVHFLREFVIPAVGFIVSVAAAWLAGMIVEGAPTIAAVSLRALTCVGSYALLMLTTGQLKVFSVFSEMKRM